METQKETGSIRKNEKIILGIDPGTRIMGFGVIKMQGSQFSFVEMGVLDLKKEDDTLLKLEKIHEEIIRIIHRHTPDFMSIETPFYGKNVQSLIKLGRAQGVAIAAALSLQVPVYEYAPLKIKQSLTGNGSASKEQVCAMVLRILNIHNEHPRYLDATDALAAAICHGLQSRILDIAPKETRSPKKRQLNISSTRKGEITGIGQKTGRQRTSSKKNSSGNNPWTEFLSKNPDRIL